MLLPHHLCQLLHKVYLVYKGKEDKVAGRSVDSSDGPDEVPDSGEVSKMLHKTALDVSVLLIFIILVNLISILSKPYQYTL